MKAISRHLNLNTLLIAAVGFLSNYYLHDIQKSMDLVRQNTMDIAVIRSQVEDLQKNCVTEARLTDVLSKHRIERTYDKEVHN